MMNKVLKHKDLKHFLDHGVTVSDSDEEEEEVDRLKALTQLFPKQKATNKSKTVGLCLF